jgi:hypothetical protein
MTISRRAARRPLFGVLLLLSTVGCTLPTHVVLQPGQALEFANDFGVGRVTYVSPLRRRIQVDADVDVEKRMIARDQPWQGKLGLYDPAGYIGWGRPLRLIYQESELIFHSAHDAARNFYEGSDVMKWVCNEDGYVVGFKRDGGTISVSIFRCFVDGVPVAGLSAWGVGHVRVIRSDGSTPERSDERGSDV